jgi:apolipoprotein N-acyltransferase
LTVQAAFAAAALAAAGALHTLAYVHTALWPLALMALALLVFVLRASSPGRALLFGWAYGVGWLAAGTWWLFISMHRYGGLPAPLAVLAVLALAAALSLYLALAASAFASWRRGHAVADALLFAALFLLAEVARGVLFTGFPWVAFGYAFVDAPLAGLAPWVGVYGLGAVAALCAALIGSLPDARTGRRATVVAAVIALLTLPAVFGPGTHTRAVGELQVTLLQPNVAQDEKFAAERLPGTLQWLAQQATGARDGLVVAPETAVPLLPAQLEEVAPGYWAALEAHFARPGRAALIGVPLGDFERGYTNSVAGLSAAAAYRYDKAHLVPFGEFIPPGFRWFVEMMHIPLGDFARGRFDQASFAVGAQRIAPNICYEDLFGEELAVRFIDPARAPTVLANVSNIGWFGDTVAIPQHLNISRMRALELQRPMLRATNTGATVVIDHLGRVQAALPALQQGVLVAVVEGRSGRTPFAGWAARLGLWPPVALALLVALVVCAWPHRREKPAALPSAGESSGEAPH